MKDRPDGFDVTRNLWFILNSREYEQIMADVTTLS